MSWDDRVAKGGGEASDIFASFFKSVYGGDPGAAPVQRTRTEESSNDMDCSLLEFNIRFDNMFNQFCKLDAKKGAGLHSLPKLFCAAALGKLITHIFSKSFEESMFPSICRKLNLSAQYI